MLAFINDEIKNTGTDPLGSVQILFAEEGFLWKDGVNPA